MLFIKKLGWEISPFWNWFVIFGQNLRSYRCFSQWTWHSRISWNNHKTRYCAAWSQLLPQLHNIFSTYFVILKKIGVKKELLITRGPWCSLPSQWNRHLSTTKDFFSKLVYISFSILSTWFLCQLLSHTHIHYLKASAESQLAVQPCYTKIPRANRSQHFCVCFSRLQRAILSTEKPGS